MKKTAVRKHGRARPDAKWPNGYADLSIIPFPASSPHKDLQIWARVSKPVAGRPKSIKFWCSGVPSDQPFSFVEAIAWVNAQRAIMDQARGLHEQAKGKPRRKK